MTTTALERSFELFAARADMHARRHRRSRGSLTIAAIVISLTVLAALMRPHPVGTARTFTKFEGKAVTTADGALSQVETVRLAAQTASLHNGFGPFLSQVLTDAEGALGGLQATFDSIQSPGTRADALQHQLDGLLSDALAHLRVVRVAVRRGQLTSLDDTAKPLSRDAAKLQQFSEQHAS